jgi:SAM-dependent methyltransferase
MSKSMKRQVINSLNSVLGLAEVELVRVNRDDDPRTFLPFRETVEGAKAAGITVSDYIDNKYNVPGATQATVDRMAGLGLFQHKIDRICEIGPGSGRYLEKIVKLCQPSHYEIYETAANWANWLTEQYSVILNPTDGKTLASTASDSIDLVQAHKVFVATPTIITIRYLLEMIRVARPGGFIIFDIVSEKCLTNEILEQWLITGIQSGPFPAMMPEQFILNLFAERGCSLVGEFFIPMKPGITHYFAFSKSA